MNNRKNVFSYIMWGIFALFLAVVYFFSFSNFVNGLGFIDKKFTEIIVVLVGAIIVEIFIIIDNLLKRAGSRSDDKKWNAFGIIGFIVAITTFIGIRVLALIYNGADRISVNGENAYLYDRALIDTTFKSYFNLSTIEDIYSTVLSTVLRFLGNKAVGIGVSQLLLSGLFAILIYFAIRMLCGRLEAFVAVIGAALLPLFTDSIFMLGTVNVELLFFATGLFLCGVIKSLNGHKVIFDILSLVCAAVFGFFTLYNTLNFGLIAFLVILILEEKNISILRKVLDTVFSILICVGTFFSSALYETYLSQNTGVLGAFIGYRFRICPDVTPLLDFARTNLIMIVVILAISYAVMFLKYEYDNAHGMVIFPVTVFGYLCFFYHKDVLSYNLAIIIVLLVLGSNGIKKIFLNSIDRTEYEEDEDEGTDIEADEEVSEELKPEESKTPELFDVPKVVRIPVEKASEDILPVLDDTDEEEFDGVLPNVSSILAANASKAEEETCVKETPIEDIPIENITEDEASDTDKAEEDSIDYDFDIKELPDELMKFDKV